MALERIEAAELAGKGNIGQPDTPGLSTEEMQRKLDELSLEVIVPKFNALVDALAADTGAGDIGAEGGRTVQEALDSVEEGKADKTAVLLKGGGEVYTPAGMYDPATKKYVDDTVISIGAGDMPKSVYDKNGDGVVDDAEQLGGQPPGYYGTAAAVAAAQAAAEAAMPKAGGAFTGSVTFAEGKEAGKLGEYTLLWENASPASSFAEQTLAIDWTPYDYLVILGSEDSCVLACQVNAYGCSVYMNYVGEIYISGRRYTLVSGGIKVFTGSRWFNGTPTSAWPSNNAPDAHIPYCIYGVKA